ncbi:MAG: hypothetical protein KJZ70_11430 [Bryobacterales bacterium]|nr:hypothetical protein [Bryobacterales bacterium]
MRNRALTGEHGTYRFRSVFFSEKGRFAQCDDLALVECRLEDRMRESVGQRRATSFLIVDNRLLASESDLVSVLPGKLRARLGRAGETSSAAAGETVRDRLQIRLRKRLPLFAGAACAAAGFWVFFQWTL